MLEKGIFPGRSVHSVNAQWQKYSNYDNKDEAIKQAMKFKSPYCISFRDIPDHPAAIKRVRSEILAGRNGFRSQMEQLTDTLMKGEYDSKLMSKIHKKVPRAVT